MKSFLTALAILIFLSANVFAQTGLKENNKELAKLFESYGMEYIARHPVFATSIGYNSFDSLLPVEFTDRYVIEEKAFFTKYLTGLSKFNREDLTDDDRLSYDIFKWNHTMALEGLTYIDNRIPFNQFGGMPFDIGQLGSGTVIQPFKTVKDYNNWISRATAFSAWADSAIVYFRKGMAEGVVLPKVLVVKMVPQMESFITSDPTKSIFYGPVNNFPKEFSDSVKLQLTNAYKKLIIEQLVPAYKKLYDFLQNDYLPKARTTSGLGGIPGGTALYDFSLRAITTTHVSANQLFNTGLAEVKRIKAEMEKIKSTVGFKGDLKAFFEYMRTDPKFFPYKTPDDVLNAYRAIEQKIQPKLQGMFLYAPKTPFEIRQTESFRAASAAAEYSAGLPNGSRPGIFYVPIVDATKKSFAEESLFAHEAIPGHHYQVMLQLEKENLPGFRRYGGFGAYSEGWGLYSEDLGKELGLYTDPYQQMAYLRWNIHRAIRLVVDPGLHAKGWTREQAIQYMLDNEPVSKEEATSEIERYMAIPGQAVAYKVGEMKILELRKKYTKELGSAFNLATFHDEILKDGAMPLDILQEKMDNWEKSRANKK